MQQLTIYDMGIPDLPPADSELFRGPVQITQAEKRELSVRRRAAVMAAMPELGGTVRARGITEFLMDRYPDLWPKDFYEARPRVRSTLDALYLAGKLTRGKGAGRTGGTEWGLAWAPREAGVIEHA